MFSLLTEPEVTMESSLYSSHFKLTFIFLFIFKRSLNDSSCSVGGSCTLEIGNVSIILEITFGNGGEHLWILASCLLVQWQEIFFLPLLTAAM